MAVSDLTRDRLLQAARELFTAAGYHETTTPALARRAGIAEGTIYRHFASKQALLNAAYQDVQQWGAASVNHSAEPSDAGGRQAANARDQLMTLARHWIATAESDPARIRMMLSWVHRRELDETSRTAEAALHAEVQQVLASGKQQGVVRAGVVELWASVWLHIVSLATERVASGEWARTHPHVSATLHAAWDAIAAPADPARTVPAARKH